MTSRWKKESFKDNTGKNCDMWVKDAFLIIANYPVYKNGTLVRWEYELVERIGRMQEKLIGRSKSLAGAKKLMRQ